VQAEPSFRSAVWFNYERGVLVFKQVEPPGQIVSTKTQQSSQE